MIREIAQVELLFWDGYAFDYLKRLLFGANWRYFFCLNIHVNKRDQEIRNP